VAARARSYPLLAGAALRGAAPSSPVQGGHPKFTTTLAESARHVAVLVKFSPPVTSELGRRWADLLVAEHLAHEILTAHGVRGCVSTVLEHDNCVFLECERFDRIDGIGRRGVVSLFALDCARYGQLDSWTACAARLARDGLLSSKDAERIAFLDAFGALTANTDRHLGNISLFDRYEGPLELAPVYDMLPMLFAPRNGRVVPRDFTPPAPQAAWLPVWVQAYQAARSYWEILTSDARISADFRDQCACCLDTLRRMPGR
jgi:serine/threonine protein kinase HipA of HipAB toxin-antitoxin module